MFCFILVDMAGGINNFSPMLGNNASLLMKNLQQLIASNPAYLTSGIPTHLIQQMWKNDPDPQAKVMLFMVSYSLPFSILDCRSEFLIQLNWILIKFFHQQMMEEEEGDDEEMGVAETYADYWPSKCKISCIQQCQSTAQC